MTVEPEDLHEWTARGFTVADARRWIDAGFRLESAERWRDSGVYRPGPALERRAAGLTASTVRPMQRHLAPRRLRGFLRPRGGLALSDHEAETLNALRSAGVPAATARAYLDAGWQDNAGVPWALAGINPAQALVYQSLGFTPSESATLNSQGHEALTLMREWWAAGIPRAEVAAWVGAGFTPQQAAVLRALTDRANHRGL